jgi:hypothetical protein
MSGRPDLSAWDIVQRGYGVCRDFAHVAIALNRTFNLPARYVTGHLPDIGFPDPENHMDFHAYAEVYVGGHWFTTDARFHVPRIGRITLSCGQDAVDGAFSTIYGGASLSYFQVWAYQVQRGTVGGGGPPRFFPPPRQSDLDCHGNSVLGGVSRSARRSPPPVRARPGVSGLEQRLDLGHRRDPLPLQRIHRRPHLNFRGTAQHCEPDALRQEVGATGSGDKQIERSVDRLLGRNEGQKGARHDRGASVAQTGIEGSPSPASVMMHSVASSRPAMEAAFCRAERVTFVGSTTPHFTRSSNSPVATL